ncbi:MAG: redoxin domain-containing protein [Myxococcales bacterium]|nr:redoxin domain-containing protein [Myxococcales bacterium]
MTTIARLLNPALALALVALAEPAFAAPSVGAKAPAFKIKDTNGKVYALADFKGKTVVLEWFNHGCPFVRKHYESKNMQKLQKRWTDKGVVWLSVNSGARGKEGFEDTKSTNKTAKAVGWAGTALVVDDKGELGKLYGATATPHMFVIDAQGNLVYAGAIDSIASTDEADLAKADNYVDAALTAVTTGEPVKVAQTQAYGCGVKYK